MVVIPWTLYDICYSKDKALCNKLY